jgi:hypothetical protein
LRRTVAPSLFLLLAFNVFTVQRSVRRLEIAACQREAAHRRKSGIGDLADHIIETPCRGQAALPALAIHTLQDRRFRLADFRFDRSLLVREHGIAEQAFRELQVERLRLASRERTQIPVREGVLRVDPLTCAPKARRTVNNSAIHPHVVHHVIERMQAGVGIESIGVRFPRSRALRRPYELQPLAQVLYLVIDRKGRHACVETLLAKEALA